MKTHSPMPALARQALRTRPDASAVEIGALLGISRTRASQAMHRLELAGLATIRYERLKHNYALAHATLTEEGMKPAESRMAQKIEGEK